MLKSLLFSYTHHLPVPYDTNQKPTSQNTKKQVDLRHMDEKSGSNVVDVGVDLSEFYMSVEWDILEVPAVR